MKLHITMSCEPPRTLPLAVALTDLGALTLEAGLVPTLTVGNGKRVACVRCWSEGPVGYETASTLERRFAESLGKAGYRVRNWISNVDELPDDAELKQKPAA